MKPSAQSAQPEAELSDVITTGMSAPPIDEAMRADECRLDEAA